MGLWKARDAGNAANKNGHIGEKSKSLPRDGELLLAQPNPDE